ncbi:MAG: lipoyl(octanoyl) transferase LipB [Alistipes sp.]|nr:lipoyl(octanoyl) transferase LipB [Alistipes sp.]
MKVLCRDLGKMDYAACWELQRSLFDSLVAAKTGLRNANPAGSGSKDEAAGTILLVEHPPVYTLGKSGHAENLLVDRPALERLGARFFHIDRGGDITFHGPGQLVCYPILDLERLGIGLRDYIDRLEETVIRTVARYGIAAGRIAGASGVWLGEEATMETGAGNKESGRPESPQTTRDTLSPKSPGTEKEGTKNEEAEKRDPLRKICAIGVRSSRYVTMHGFALNVTTDLGWFSRINPCGFSDRGVTSIARETGRDAAMDEVKRLVLRELEEQLGIKVEYEN